MTNEIYLQGNGIAGASNTGNADVAIFAGDLSTARSKIFKPLLMALVALTIASVVTSLLAYVWSNYLLSFSAFLTSILLLTLLVTAYVDFLTSDSMGRMGFIFSKRKTTSQPRRVLMPREQRWGSSLKPGPRGEHSPGSIDLLEMLQGSSQNADELVRI
jgi:hypothetical protein